VRALSLPGTYHEKISRVGDSLKHFSRLKSLDLSRNAIESLAVKLKLLELLQDSLIFLYVLPINIEY